MCLLASTLLHSRDFKLQIFKKIVRFFLHYVLNVLELWVAFVVTEYSQLLRHVCCHLMFDKSKVKIKILQMSECVICFSEFGIEANRIAYRQVYMLVSCVFNLILLGFFSKILTCINIYFLWYWHHFCLIVCCLLYQYLIFKKTVVINIYAQGIHALFILLYFEFYCLWNF